MDDVVDELYGGTLDDFVARRDAAVRAARAAKDRELAGRIASLRKPTVAAWAVNVLVRDDPALADALRDLGAGMRDAERTLDGPALRELGRQRRALVSGLVARARRLTADAGQKLSTAAAQEVEQTLTAALADPRVADAVAAGTLTHGTEHVGFGAARDDTSDREALPPLSGDDASRPVARGAGEDGGAGHGPGDGEASGGRTTSGATDGGGSDGRVGDGRRSGAAGARGATLRPPGRAPGAGDAPASERGSAPDRAAAARERERQRQERDREREEREQERLRRRHAQAVAARQAAQADLDRATTRHEDAATSEQRASAALEDAEKASADAYAAEEELVRLLADVRRRLADARAALPRADETLVAARNASRDTQKTSRAAARELERASRAAERARDLERRASQDLP